MNINNGEIERELEKHFEIKAVAWFILQSIILLMQERAVESKYISAQKGKCTVRGRIYYYTFIYGSHNGDFKFIRLNIYSCC